LLTALTSSSEPSQPPARLAKPALFRAACFRTGAKEICDFARAFACLRIVGFFDGIIFNRQLSLAFTG